ncbi:beta-ketoacyl-ACP synthase II [Allostreptomyces psammosilenae]|uniref:3-oxoacyl-[acyl-carrier-protein] synthase 2 n=1 Tax=Allostreptomyces psammosilenae TaxID=1892865 RepID=A0A852ZWX7_9ACTN|nr:beta-ketoacyl-ACP synthase II [Allostreptomyces psammosilenae]NYI06709.1 3-oxoacyl-[acyl-carrier-protein] synthase II [Allostreptomyces psammosilenae]
MTASDTSRSRGTEPRTVVVTGLGATTPLGGDVASTWEGMLAGRSGVRAITEPWAEQLPVRIAGQVAVDPTEVMSRVEARKLDRSAQLALVATREAWADAGFTAPAGEDAALPDATRVTVAVGSGIGGVTTLLNQWDVLREKGARRMSPHTVPMLMPNSPSANVELEVGARGGAHSLVSACATGAENIGYAMEMIRSGRADVVVTGGTEAAIHPMPLGAFAAMMALSKRNDEPERASRPYDKGRDGFVMGEGAGILVLESKEHAEARGARIYAEIAGQGLSSDAHHIAQPEPTGRGIIQAVRAALADAGIPLEEVLHVNAHATSTELGDLAEIKALREVLGEHASRLVITATKSMTGHMLGATGAVENIATVLALYHRLVPPTINLEDRDNEVDLDVVVHEPRPLPAEGRISALNNSFGFGGHNVVIAVRSV